MEEEPRNDEDGKELHLDKKSGYKRKKDQKGSEKESSPYHRDTTNHVVPGIV